MVRRWSRVNEFNFSLKNKKLFFFKKSSKSRVFKLTVSTRKFFKKFSKFRRKAFNRLRHRSNWLIYSNVLKFWSHDYLKTKTFNKKIWLIQNQQFNFIIFNWSCVKNLNTDIFFNLDYNLLNLNAFFLKQASTFFKNFFFWNKLKNASLLLNNELPLNDDISGFSLALYDNFFYEISEINNSTLKSNAFFFFTNNFNVVKQWELYLYQIIIYLTLLDL